MELPLLQSRVIENALELLGDCSSIKGRAAVSRTRVEATFERSSATRNLIVRTTTNRANPNRPRTPTNDSARGTFFIVVWLIELGFATAQMFRRADLDESRKDETGFTPAFAGSNSLVVLTREMR
jgi:hypothetical protein